MRGPKALVAVLVAAAVVLSPGLAGAQSTTLAEAKTLCDNAIGRRLTDLGTVKSRVDAATHVTAQDRHSLDTEIGTATSGLTQLKATIDADTTLLKLRVDCRQIVTVYRVYLVLIPKVRLVVATDRVGAAADALTHLATLLQARVDAAKARGKDVSAAQGYVSDIGVKVQAARSAVANVVSSVLPLAATGFPGNRSTLTTARSAVGTAHAALAGALSDAQKAIAALNSLG